VAAPGIRGGVGRGGLTTRSSGLHVRGVRGGRGFRRGWGGGWDDWYCDDTLYYYNGYCY
jgi:hypothetical protein